MDLNKILTERFNAAVAVSEGQEQVKKTKKRTRARARRLTPGEEYWANMPNAQFDKESIKKGE